MYRPRWQRVRPGLSTRRPQVTRNISENLLQVSHVGGNPGGAKDSGLLQVCNLTFVTRPPRCPRYMYGIYAIGCICIAFAALPDNLS